MERSNIPTVPLPTIAFEMTTLSVEEIRMIVGKARNRSAPGANGVPYLVYKRCTRVMRLLHTFIEKAWPSGIVNKEWKRAEGIFIPKESRGIKQADFAAKRWGKSLFRHYGPEAHPVYDDEPLRQYFGARKELYQAYLGALNSTMIWEKIQRAKKNRLRLYVWLDLAKVCGAVLHQLIWKTLVTHHVPKPVIQIPQNYFDGLMVRFTIEISHLGRCNSRLVLLWSVPSLPPSSYWQFRLFSMQRAYAFQRLTSTAGLAFFRSRPLWMIQPCPRIENRSCSKRWTSWPAQLVPNIVHTRKIQKPRSHKMKHLRRRVYFWKKDGDQFQEKFRKVACRDLSRNLSLGVNQGPWPIFQMATDLTRFSDLFCISKTRLN